MMIFHIALMEPIVIFNMKTITCGENLKFVKMHN